MREGRDVLIVSSGSIALGRSQAEIAARRAEARGEPGGRRGRADRAGAHLVGSARRARHRRRADPGDAAGHRGAPPLSQRALDHRETAGLARGARHQRERHGRHQRDPLRRQRSPRRARRHHGERRSADPARPTSTGSTTRRRRRIRTRSSIPVVDSVTAEIEAMAGEAESELSRGGMRTKIEAAKIATTGGTHMLIASGQDRASVAGDRRWRPLHLVPDARQSHHRAKTLDRGLAGAEGHADHRCRRGQRAARGQEPAAGRRDPGRRPVRARRCRGGARPRHPRGRPRPRRLRRRGCREDQGPLLARHRWRSSASAAAPR